MAEVGGDAIPARDETHARLRQRLKQSTSLDNPRIVVCKRGRHGYFKHQNDIQARERAQSRRATYGDPVQPTLNDEAGRTMVRMRGYMHLYRHREDMRMCRPMPASLRALRDALYSQVWGYFSWPVCCAPCVPGSCCHTNSSHYKPYNKGIAYSEKLIVDYKLVELIVQFKLGLSCEYRCE